MAEPNNTPVPASTPRSASPAPHYAHGIPDAPVIPITSFSTSPISLSKGHKLRVLHLGDPVHYNPDTYAKFVSQFEVIRPTAAERQRPEFTQALREHRWGDFHAIFRPFWGTGGEMGKWDQELIGLLPESVKVFASAGAGFDWVDTKILGENGIIYCNSGIACAEAVADFAVAMIISTFRVLPWCIVSALSDHTDDFAVCHRDATARSHNLRGHVLGLIGLGNIGQQIAARCYHGFGMQIHYFDVAKIPPAVALSLGGAVSHPSLQSLLRRADCVVLCAPAAHGSDGPLIGPDELKAFHYGTRFVNVARGSLVDDVAIADALDSGVLSNVALDVHPDEPNIHERLKKHAREGRAMLTCHNAGGTVETHKGFEELSMRNIMAVLGGDKPISPVNLQYLR